MFSKKLKKSFLISAFLVAGIASLAFARGGWDGWGGCGGDGYGPHMGRGMMWGGHGPGGRGYHKWDNGRWGNLTEDQRVKVDAAREKFYADTEALRTQLREKQFALREEMNKETPDSAKVAQLQKELSQYEAEFDQKRVQHQLEMRQLLPEGSRYPGHGPGHGRGFRGNHGRW